jgi:hypothetical protein
MSKNRSNRGALLALVLATSAAGVDGCKAQRTHPYADFDPPTKGVFVIADDVVVPDPLPVSRDKKQVVHWASFPGTTLTVTFDAPSPFPKLKCEKNVCKSGPIDEKAAYNPYHYRASVAGPAPLAEQKPAGDPTVIIEY